MVFFVQHDNCHWIGIKIITNLEIRKYNFIRYGYADNHPIIADTYRNVGVVGVNYSLLCAPRTHNRADATP